MRLSEKTMPYTDCEMEILSTCAVTLAVLDALYLLRWL